jgi:hypothetical protein
LIYGKCQFSFSKIFKGVINMHYRVISENTKIIKVNDIDTNKHFIVSEEVDTDISKTLILVGDMFYWMSIPGMEVFSNENFSSIKDAVNFEIELENEVYVYDDFDDVTSTYYS